MANVYDLIFILGVIVEATDMANVYDLTFISGVIVEAIDMANVYNLPAAIVCFLTSVSALEDTIQILRKIVCFVFGKIVRCLIFVA